MVRLPRNGKTNILIELKASNVTIVTMVRCKNLPDSDQSDFRCRRAIDSSGLEKAVMACIKLWPYLIYLNFCKIFIITSWTFVKWFAGDIMMTLYLQVGLPAKSGVSGCVLLVVPNVMGICMWSPPLDELGNSVRGLAFSQVRRKKIQLKAIITRSNIVKYCINNCRNWDRISVRCGIHKRHHIARPNGRAMVCLLLIFF